MKKTLLVLILLLAVGAQAQARPTLPPLPIKPGNLINYTLEGHTVHVYWITPSYGNRQFYSELGACKVAVQSIPSVASAVLVIGSEDDMAVVGWVIPDVDDWVGTRLTTAQVLSALGDASFKRILP